MTPIEIVVWNDAHALEHEWTEQKDVECKPLVVTSIGFVVAENELGICLALDQSEDGYYNGIGFIPKSCVVSRQVLTPLT